MAEHTICVAILKGKVAKQCSARVRFDLHSVVDTLRVTPRRVSEEERFCQEDFFEGGARQECHREECFCQEDFFEGGARQECHREECFCQEDFYREDFYREGFCKETGTR